MMIIQVAGMVAALIAAFVAEGSVAPKCPLPGDWVLDEEVSDEFDGVALDKDKWWDYAPHWPGRPGVYRTLARNVSQTNGNLCLVTDKVPDDEIPYEARMDGMQGYTCALVKSRKKVMYGYFEARIKATPAAIRNAFWLYDPLSDDLTRKYSPGDVSEEIDICEILGRHQTGDAMQDYLTSHYTHHYLTPYYEGVCNNLNVPLGFMRKLAFCPSEDYHTYGLLWTEDELVWYVDNKESARMTASSFGQGGFRRPLHVVLDTEVNDWSGAKVSELDARTLPAAAKVDWFRRWRPRTRPVPGQALMSRIKNGPEVIGIVHWGLNTYTDREWGYGDENPADLNPAQFNADQIAQSCADGGLGGLVIVAKHHDGFCLWPTKTTKHNITKAPFRGGKGDYVREMADACRRAGVKFGVYVSPWDRNNADYGNPKYVETYHAQIKELLGGDYGEVFEMWFDGANGGGGYYGGSREKRKIPNGYYRFGEVFKFVRELQPNACIFAGEDNSDFRWPGNEQGFLDSDSRATVCTVGAFVNGRRNNPEYERCVNTGCVDGRFFRMCEADFPLRPGWFYHANERGKSKSAAYLMNRFLVTVGNGGTMNIGIAPNMDGLLDDEDVKALRGFGELRQAFFANEVTDPAKPFNIVVLCEDVASGEQVDDWSVLVNDEKILSGKSVGRKRIRILDRPVIARYGVRVVVNSGSVSHHLYYADPDLVKLVRSATTESGETDTAKWMTGAEKENAVASCRDDCREVVAVKGEAPSFLPKEKNFKLVWHDEFDGTALDETKWCFRTNFWGRRASWFAAPEDGAVEVGGGFARLKIVERNGQLKSPQLQTGGLLWDIPQKRNGIWLFPERAKAKYLKRYGYFECRCRLQQLPGWWSAFWMQAEANGATTDPAASGIEHDIMESFSPGKVIPSFFHFNGYGAEYRNFASSRRPIGENEMLSVQVDKSRFHTFGMLWEPDGYTLYLDGKKRGYKVGTGPGETVSHVPEFILVTTEVKGCREPGSVDSTYGSGIATPESYETARRGDDFVVDYVRVFDIVDPEKRN